MSKVKQGHFGSSKERGRERLVLLTRYPEPGVTKTRLIPVLGKDGAADLQRRMTRHIVGVAQRASAHRLLEFEIRYAGGGKSLMRRWLGPGLLLRYQGPGDLGERIARALLDAFDADVQRVAVIGSDSPELTAETIQNAFEMLLKRDLVLGPANDGGYYLIGMNSGIPRSVIPRLFQGIEWGTGEVLERTILIAEQHKLSLGKLDALDDVDRIEDLPVWDKVRKDRDRCRLSAPISIIIPTLNEAENIRLTLEQASRGSSVEVIVVDGGSSDGTPGIASSLGARVLTCPPSRAGQMNAGAAAATGELLVFLHADTRLPEGFDACVRGTLLKPRVIAGCFELCYGSPLKRLRWIERTANFRARSRQLPYGDQAIFLRADTFRELGGFPDLPVMEDLAFVRTLRRRGRIEVVPKPAVSSPRRYLRRGPLTTSLITKLAIAAYRVGVPPSRIAEWYNAGSARNRPPQALKETP